METRLPSAETPTVAIAGASGFVGRALARELAERCRVVGLSRGRHEEDSSFSGWRECDLFSALDAERALGGADYAYYLVHSMLPSAHLTQGSFRDLDLICADNFARSAKKCGVKQIIYLGGLVPERSDGAKLSPHLASRLEVEQALGAHGVPVTSLRAGLVIGAEGSSFGMMKSLVERLPAMILPSWTSTRMQPIAIDDVVDLLAYVLGREACIGQRFDVGSPDVLTYRELLALTAELLGQHRPMVSVPFVSTTLSRYWVSLITGAPGKLVGPLVESLEHEMIAKDRRLQEMANIPGLSARDALLRAFSEERRGQAGDRAYESHEGIGAALEPISSPAAPSNRSGHDASAPHHASKSEGLVGRDGGADLATSHKRGDHRVRSVQRLSLPPGRDAAWAADEYMRWLPVFFVGLIHVDIDEHDICRFHVPWLDVDLLVLTHSDERSTPDRQLFYVTGGVLARLTKRGRFELRQVLDGRVLLAAIHDFEPQLPWPIYIATQARFHQSVMRAFGRHLRRAAIPRAPHIVEKPG